MSGDFAREHMTGWLDLNVASGRYSSLLVAELATHYTERTLNVFAVLDEIGVLEGRKPHSYTRTKPATKFRRSPLKGLWHKHYFQAAHMLRNLSNHWAHGDRLGRMAEQILDRSSNAEEAIKRATHEFVIGGYEARTQQRQLTGEFIVYAGHDGANYYLTLGHHGDDEGIAARVQACATEFPFILKTFESRNPR